MTLQLRRLSAWLTGLCLFLGVAVPAGAQQYPRFTGARLYLVFVDDSGFDAVLERIEQVERSGPETYYLVVAASTGAGSTATRDYTDRLYQRWRSEARASGRTLDPDRHVIIVLGIENRQISVHAGVRLQNDLGFRDSTIDTEVVQPIFIPHARAGDFDRGAAALVEGIHRWFRRKEAAHAQVRRAQEHRRQQERAAVAAGLREERSQLQALSARVVQDGREGLATATLEKSLAGLVPRLRQVEALVGEQPEAAGETLRGVRETRSTLAQQLSGLRSLRDRARQAYAQAEQAVGRAEAELKRGKSSGLAITDLEAGLTDLQNRLEQTGADLSADYQHAVSESGAIASRAAELFGTVGQRESERRHRQFMTRTLPLAIGATLLLLVLAGLIGLRVRHLRLKGAVTEQLEGLLLELVRCMERLEALTERHKLLMGADLDFTAPIVGRTLALYEETEGVLRSAWGVWDQLVASRDAIQSLLGQEGLLGRQRLQAARERLDELQRSRELLILLETVAANLDRLNAAHETARTAIQALQAEQLQAAERLTRLAARELSQQPYDRARQAAEAAAGDAEGHYEADPLTAQEVAEQGAAEAGNWNAWMERVLAGADGHAASLQRASALEESARKRRAEGFLLTEAGGNPDPPLADARAILEKVWSHLQAAADVPAREGLAAASELLGQGEAAVDAQVRGRAFCDTDLPARRAETQRLFGHLAQAAVAREDLAREFARSCWQNVEGHCAGAEAGLAEFDRLCQQAESRMDPRSQQYLSAQSLLHEVGRGQAETEAALTAVEQTLTTLRAIRSQVQADLPRVQELARTTGTYAAGNAVSLRAAARECLGTGRAALAASTAAAALAPPDWLTAARRMQEGEAALASAFALAQQDVAAHQRVLQCLESTERAYAQAEAYIRQETADRPAAAYRLANAHQSLEEARRRVQVAGADWPTLETQLDQATATANTAQEMAREDVRLHQQAQSELRSAERALSSADCYYGHGIRGDTGQAAGMLRQAASALHSSQYEEVVRMASQAVMLAQAAERSAEARVRQIEDEIRRRREEEERRQREAEERRRREAEEAEERRRASNSSSGSSSSSYTSGTSQSSW